MIEATLLYRVGCKLGEGPMWHEKRNSCFWVDIDDRSFYEYNWLTTEVKRWQLDRQPSLIVETRDDKLLIATETGIAVFDFRTSVLHPLLDIEKDITGNRSNDGGCDVRGRLWLGTMAKDAKPHEGSLYCIKPDLSITKKLAGLTISNGIAWSPANDRMYYIDSTTQSVQAFSFNPETAEIHFEKMVIEISPDQGIPDGMAIDEEGMLWIALYNGFGIYRYNPHTGKLLEKISVPVPQVTCCAFGGEHLDHLFITTAREKMDEKDLRQYPQSGDLFVAKTPVKGLKKYKFG